MISYRDALPEDFAAIVPNLREADCEEWRVASGATPAEHLKNGTWSVPTATTGRRCRVALDGSHPVLLYGVDPSPVPGHGWVWLVACNRAEQHAIEFHRSWDAEVALLHADYAKLITASWIGNTKHHRWLKWIGFKPFGIPLPGPHGGAFQPFIYGD